MVVVASGYFDPIHVGHIEYLKRSKCIADSLEQQLFVIVNNNSQKKAKGKLFMDESERVEIVRNLGCVDCALISIDEDGSVCKTLELIHQLFGVSAFTNGGDQTNRDMAERNTCIKYEIKMVDGLGKKIQSSRWLVNGK